jgi:lysylphosphatidylglycerol synthetase-like protein (DUF2156 family)
MLCGTRRKAFMLDVRFPQWNYLAQRFRVKREVLALAVAIMGIINELTVLVPARPGRFSLFISLLNLLAPFSLSIWPFVNTGRTIALILGFFLLLLAFGLVRGKRRAWEVTIVLLPLSALAHLLKGLDFEEALLTMILWLALLGNKRHFRVASDPWHMKQGLGLLIVGFILLFFYSMSGFYLLHRQIILPESFGGVVHSWLQRLVNLPAGDLTPLTRRAAWFLQSIPWLSATVLLTGFFFLLRPVSARWWIAYQKDRLAQARQKMMELVYRYGSHTLSFFALAPQNLYYLAPRAEGVVSYRLANTVAVVLGDPICAPGSFEYVTRQFLELCRLQGWQVAFYQAHPEYLPVYRSLGLSAFKIGEEAMLYPQRFTLSGSALANVRTSSRRAERDGVKIEWYEGSPPQQILEQLHMVSSAWLEYKGEKRGTEMGFSMGRLDELADAASWADAVAELCSKQSHGLAEAIPRLVTGIAFNGAGQLCAFVTFTPLYGSHTTPSGTSEVDGPAEGRGWALDLMRRLPNAPPGTIELLIVRGIEWFKQRAAQVVSLGMVAMADTRGETTASQRQLASFVSEHLRLLETHRTLFRFKQKFQPCWESRYVVASTPLALPKIALALLRVHNS